MSAARRGWRALWAVACNDVAAWLRSPWSIVAAVLPPLGMAALVAVLTLAVGKQPVAMIVNDTGPEATRMAQIFQANNDAYRLRTLTQTQAAAALKEQRVAAIITIPADFGERVARGAATVGLTLNNVDVDFSDDIRRSVTRSVAQFDAPELGGNTGSRDALLLQALREVSNPGEAAARPAVVSLTPNTNPYRVGIAERDTRRTKVAFLKYEVLPILILAIINIGMLGTALLCAREFEGRTVKLLLLSPAARGALVGGKLLGGVLASTAVVAPLVALGAARRIIAPPAAHWAPLLLLLAAVTLMAAGLGLLLGVALRQGRLVTMVGLNLATCLFFLGGGFTTIAFLPGWLQAISALLPTSYAIDGLRQALFYPDLQGFGRDMLVLCGSAAAAAALGTLALARGWRRA